MPASRRVLIAGNWKMNGLKSSLAEIEALAAGYDGDLKAKLDLLVCPPATLLISAAERLAGSGVQLGGQNCHPAPAGAHTGGISAEMLKDAGVTSVIVGHSERRTNLSESDAVVMAKVKAAWCFGLLPIVCVGETAEERDAGEAVGVVTRQVHQSLPEGCTASNLVIAYEPVWAIGTGRTPTPEDVANIHGTIRSVLKSQFGAEADGIRILYGGSVKPDNAATLMAVADVDGALVGGASLKAADFLAIARATPAR
ncbi:triose-phosphate isomerase [Xanthobacter oligotrophicus]|uniref:Triosephosphate isomerase n=1 Tax=Xanthobacter oligotrophicus TaxID=2607286 RepID=A0ABW6ZQX5_9HYPH